MMQGIINPQRQKQIKIIINLHPLGSLILKKEIWKLEILSKIQQFLWKTISGALPTYVQLCTRRINTDPVFQCCCMEEDTINHLMFLSPHVLAIWRCSGFPVHDIQSFDLEQNITALFNIYKSKETSKDLSNLSFWFIWYTYMKIEE